MPTAHLADRAVIQVQGEDAQSFLQGIVTCNIESLKSGEARLGALLSPQGKILFDFLVTHAPEGGQNVSTFGGGYFLDCVSDHVAGLIKRLSLYRLRAKVVIRHVFEEGEPLAVAVAWGDDRVYQTDALLVGDGRLGELGERLYLWEHDARAIGSHDESDYHAHRIGLGVPEAGRDFPLGDAFPHEALMDQLGGVDFKKGCYVGQEVVSRMQHRGTARTRILPATYAGGEAAEPGSEITAGSKVLGLTGSRAGGRGLVMLRIDRLADAVAAGEPLRADGKVLGVARPAFATFAMPEAVGAVAG